MFYLYNCFGISSSLQLLQFGISLCNLVFLLCLCNCFGISSSLQFLQFGISFCNLVFLFCLCNCFGISSFLQFLQFGIWVKFLQKNLEWYFVFRFCKIWYFDCPLASAIWYFSLSLQLFWYFIFSSVSAIWYQLLQFGIFVVSVIVLVFRLLFSFCNLVFELSFCKKFWSDILSSASAKSGISTFLQLLSWHLLPKRLFGYVGYLLIW
jgi:hypothetical protein